MDLPSTTPLVTLSTPALQAAGHTDAAALEALLVERADVDARDLGGFTALMPLGLKRGDDVERGGRWMVTMWMV